MTEDNILSLLLSLSVVLFLAPAVIPAFGRHQASMRVATLMVYGVALLLAIAAVVQWLVRG